MTRAAVPRAAVVDPFDAGALLAPALRARGVESVGVVSSPRVARGIRSDACWSDFASVRRHRGDVAATAAALRRRGVAHVFVGCETGVGLADALAHALGAPGNGVDLSPARRHKFLMAESVRAHGLPVPAQACGAALPDLLAWIGTRLRYPIVAKPPHSLGFDGVTPCRSPEDVARAFEAIVGKRNPTGLVNDALVVQETLGGELYAVDTVSRDGRHLLCGVWRYLRPDPPPPPRRRLGREASRLHAYATLGTAGKRLCAADDAVAQGLFAYAARVLDALDVRHGPGHCEVAWTADGPRLLELGARVHGGRLTHELARVCTGTTQVERTLDASLAPASFAAALAAPYRLRQEAAVVRLTPRSPGVLRGFPRLPEVEALPSVRSLRHLLPVGRRVGKVVGLVVLCHADGRVVDRDVAAIRALERDGLYEVGA